MGSDEVQAFLTFLANDRRIAPSTHRQALAAILYLYKEVLGIALPWMDRDSCRVVACRSRAVACGRERRASAHLSDVVCGAGLRLMECVSLRVKDLDFDRKTIVVRQGKGGKDRVVMLPGTLIEPLRLQLERSRSLWAEDRAAHRPGVWLPDALARKYPRSGESWSWHWAFPSPTLSTDPRTNIHRRHHQYEQSIGRAISNAESAGISAVCYASSKRHAAWYLQPSLRICSSSDGYSTPAAFAESA
jgi:integrase